MFSRSELLDAIDELESSPATYQNAEKLATFYTLYDHLFAVRVSRAAAAEPIREVTIGKYGDSEFLRTVEGKDANKIWAVLDELMFVVKSTQPKLYSATLDKLSE